MPTARSEDYPFEPAIVDANVLVYSLNADDPRHGACRALLVTARSESTTLFVTSQILCEVYSVVTSPRRFPYACTPEEAIGIIETLLSLPGLKVCRALRARWHN